MRYIGIDYGTKRVGVALSDESGRLAFPHSVLKSDKTLLSKIENITKEQKVGIVVLGESKDFKGKDNLVSAKIAEFKKELEDKTGRKVEYEPEFLTSVQAARWQLRRPEASRGSGIRSKNWRANDMLDASAAAIILQSYLDRKN